MRKSFSTIAPWVLAGASLLASATVVAQPATPTLPTMKILSAPLVAPTAAQTFYGAATARTSSFAGVSGFEGRPPEIVELARALKNDPDLIYEFVRNHIDTEFSFGLRKGAVGSLIDKSGTPFDQNMLFVETVRQAGHSARYRIGQATLSGASFANWSGITDAGAACKFLAASGIPATINGSSPSDCSVAGAITSVTLLHVWSEVSIGGVWYAFEPSLKTRTSASVWNFVSGSGYSTGAAASNLESGLVAGSDSGVPYVKSANASALDGYLQARSSQLLTDIRTNGFSKAMSEVLGLGKIAPEYKPANGWRNASPAGFSSVSGSVTITGDIPDQYRTKLTVQLQVFGTAELRLNKTIYSDETYGRRIAIDTNFDQAHNINDTNLLPWAPEFTFEVDDVALQTYSCTVAPAQNPTCPVDSAPNGPVKLILDHPFAANSGAYADETVVKNATVIIPVVVALGFGDTSSSLQAKWGGEAVDKALPLQGHKPAPCGPIEENGTCANAYGDSAGDITRQKLFAGWLQQVTGMLRIHDAIAQTKTLHQHTLGVVHANGTLGGWWPYWTQAGSGPRFYGVDDVRTELNLDSAVSVVSLTGDTAKANAVARAVALSAATLESSLLEQTEDLADSVSTAARLAWANTPDNEDPCNVGARKIYDFTGSTSTTRSALLTYEGSAQGCGAGPTFQFISQPWTGWKNGLESSLSAYLANSGYRVVASSESFLGPGSRTGQANITKQPNPGGYIVEYNLSVQRGGAIIATKTDASGNVIEIAHVLSDRSGGLIKGGAGKEPQDAGTYDPNKAADVLKDKFVDKSSVLGVDLKNGTAGYSTPALLSVGNGEMPFKLDYNLTYKPGQSGCTLFGPCTGAVQGGWTHNWDIRFSMGSSGSEALGATSPQAAASTIVAFMAIQDVFAQSALSGLKQDVYAALVADTWRRSIQSNTATVSQGFGGQQFVKLADGTWLAPVNSPGTLVQTGSRTKVRDTCRSPGGSGNGIASVTRRWDHMNVSFALTKADGQAMNFAPWKYNYDIEDQCKLTYGFKITTWTMPQGGQLTFATDGAGAVTSVATNAGRTLTVTPPFTNNGLDPSQPGLTSASANGLSTARAVSDGTITDAGGSQWKFAYNPVLTRSATQRPVPYKQLKHVFEPVNQTLPALEYTYDSRGLVKEAKDAMALQWYPRRSHKFFIAEGARGERQDPQGATEAGDGRFVVYSDTDGNVVRYIDEIGRMSLASYDGRNRVIERTNPEGDKAQYLYDSRDNVVKLTRKAKPGSGLADQIIEAAWHTQWNKPIWIKDMLGRQTDFTYVASGNGASLLLTALRPAVGGQRPTYAFTYDGLGRVLTATDPTGLVVQNTYDGVNGTPVTVANDPTGINAVTTTAYDAVGNAISSTDPRGNTVTVQYDNMRRKTAEQNRQGSATGTILARSKITYDQSGRPIKEERALTLDGSGNGLTWAKTETVYTPTSKKSRTIDADGRVTTYGYDGLDRLVTTVDPEGRVTGTVYDLASQVLIEKRAVGTPLVQNYATYTYSANGQKLSVADAKNNLTSYTFDGFDRPLRTTFPDLTYEENTYDAAGNVLTKRARSAQVMVNTYDALDRLATHLTPQPGGASAITAAYVYDLAGRPLNVSDSTGNVLANTYDSAKRVIAVAQTFGSGGPTRTLAYQFDLAGAKTRVTHPDGYYVAYAYDPLGRMATATENGTHLLATYVYDRLSRPTDLVMGNGAIRTTAYTAFGDMTTLAHTMTGTANTYTFAFTRAHQLKSEDVTNAAWRYTPSLFQTVAYSPANALNQYVAVTAGANPPQTILYDANGNLTGDGVWTFAYDAENRLRTATKAGTSASYAYDVMSRRQAKTVNGVVTQFLSDGAEEIAEYDGAGALLRRYVTGPGTDMPIAMVTAAGARSYFHVNRQGSTIAMSGDNGQMSEGTYTYDAFGDGAPATGVPFKYTGRRLDPETGLYYYRARYYSAALGRFLQTDPIGYKDQMNLYAYVGNDPLNATDPTGEIGVVGFVLGFGTSVAYQMLVEGKPLDEVDLVSAAVDGAVGAAGLGLVKNATRLIKAYKGIEPAAKIAAKAERHLASRVARGKDTYHATRQAQDKADAANVSVSETLGSVAVLGGVVAGKYAIKEALPKVTVRDAKDFATGVAGEIDKTVKHGFESLRKNIDSKSR